jgi:hypothetical protein
VGAQTTGHTNDGAVTGALLSSQPLPVVSGEAPYLRAVLAIDWKKMASAAPIFFFSFMK